MQLLRGCDALMWCINYSMISVLDRIVCIVGQLILKANFKVFICFYFLFQPLFRGFLKLGQKYKNIFVVFVVQIKTLKFAFKVNTWNLLEYIGNQSNYINSVWFTIKKIRIYATTMQRAMRPPLIKSGTKKNHVCEIAFRAWSVCELNVCLINVKYFIRIIYKKGSKNL